MNSKLLNFIGFQALWLVTVLGAAAGYPQTGLLALPIWLAAHLSQIREQRGSELVLVTFAALYGYLVDSLLVSQGFIGFPQQAVLGGPSTLWMVVLWAGFATTIRHSLAWLSASIPLAAVFGLIGGPLAYFAGVRLGALEIYGGLPAFIAIAAEWAVSMVLLVSFSRYLGRTPAPLLAGKSAG